MNNTTYRNNIPFRWWDEPILSLEEYKYLYNNNRWWDNNILSLEEYYKIEKCLIKNKIIKILLNNLKEPKLDILTYSFERR